MKLPMIVVDSPKVSSLFHQKIGGLDCSAFYESTQTFGMIFGIPFWSIATNKLCTCLVG